MRDTHRLTSLLSLLAILLVLSFGGAYWVGQLVIAKTAFVAHEQRIIDALEECLSTIKDAETGQRGYLLTGEDPYLDPYNNAVARVRGQLKALATLAADGPLTPSDLGELQRLVDTKLAELDRTIDLRRSGKTAEALAIVRSDSGRQLMTGIRETIARAVAEQTRNLQTARDTADRYTTYRTVGYGIITVADLAFLYWVYRLLEREVNLRAAAAREVRRQKDLLDVTLASIGDGVIVTDAAGRVTFLNDVAQKLTGWAAAEAYTQPCGTVFNIINETSRQRVESPVDKVLATGVIVGLANHTLLIRRDGTEIPIDDSGAPIRGADGTVQGVVLIFRDFSSHKASERQLRESAEQIKGLNEQLRLRVSELETLFAVAPIGLAVAADRQATDVRVNPAMAKILAAEGANGPPPHKIFHNGAELSREAWPLQATAATGQPSGEMELRVEFDDGRRVDLLGGAAPLLDTDGNPRGAIGAFFDIGDRKRYEADLRKAKDDAEAANQAKDRFLAMISHELRTPLSPVMATLSTWEVSDELPDAFREDVQMIRRNIDLEARLIDDLLDINRIVSGKLQLNLELADIHALVRSVIGMYQSDVLGKGLKLSVTVTGQQRWVRADPGRLQQVIWNVLKNSTKFTPPGGRIDVRLADEGGNIAVTFTDTGIGMSQQTIDRIFRPFEQGDAEMVRRAGGLGLGMAISKLLIEMQNGTISASSPGQDQGATFKILLPAVAAPNDMNRPTASTDPASPAPPASRGKPLSILLVEDHPDTAKAMGRLLSRLGHKVEIRDTVAGAIELSRSWDYDVLLSDIGLPDGTGLELIRQIKAMRQVPSIALTGYGMEEDVAKCREAGFDTHLTKPVNFQKLEIMIQDVVSKAGNA